MLSTCWSLLNDEWWVSQYHHSPSFIFWRLPKFSGRRKDRRRRIGSEPIPVMTDQSLELHSHYSWSFCTTCRRGLWCGSCIWCGWCIERLTLQYTTAIQIPLQVCKASFHASIVQPPNALSNDEVTLDYCLFDGVVSRRGMGDPKLQE
jgi:hypothetical protein